MPPSRRMRINELKVLRIFLSSLFAVGALAMSAKADAKGALHVVYAKATIVESVDTDSDGLADSTEAAIGTDPAVRDTDGDGLTDGDEEVMLNTFATIADSDGDGFGDGLEVAAGADPRSANSVPVTIAGKVVNGTYLAGPVRARLIVSNSFEWITNNTAAIQVCREFAAEDCPARFTFTNAVASGVAFRIDAWADVNGNGIWENWEPAGSFASDGAAAPGVDDIEICLTCDDLADSDGNGLADTWEWRYFGKLGNSATADPDDDGLNNEGESRWGTDPFNDDTDNDGMKDGDEVYVGFSPVEAYKTPQLRLCRTVDGKFRLEWDTRYYQGYMPQYTDRLSVPAWSNLVPHTVYEYDAYPYGTKSVIDVRTNAPMRFYRIKLVK